MPIPFILAGLGILFGTFGIGAIIDGCSKAMKAKDIMKRAQARHDENISRYEKIQNACTAVMDKLGTLEMEILSSFGHFSDLIEKIQGRPKFEEIDFGDRSLPHYDRQQLKDVSVGAGVLLGCLGGAVAGTAGGMAAAGAVSAAVIALGSASTGTAIAGLSGAALTNATLTLLGGGTLAAGGGGVALGSTLLGVATLGIGLMVGGIILSLVGSKLTEKADEAWSQVEREEKMINKACAFLDELKEISASYRGTLEKVRHLYVSHIDFLEKLLRRGTDWNTFSDADRQKIQNLVHLVSILYAMCKEKLVLKSEKDNDINTINKEGVTAQMTRAERTLGQMH